MAIQSVCVDMRPAFPVAVEKSSEPCPVFAYLVAGAWEPPCEPPLELNGREKFTPHPRPDGDAVSGRQNLQLPQPGRFACLELTASDQVCLLRLRQIDLVPRQEHIAPAVAVGDAGV